MTTLVISCSNSSLIILLSPISKSYCLVIIDDYSRFSWVFFLASKDETPTVLKTFIIGLENLLSLKVKIIICDNGTEFKNADLNQFCGLKGIKREFSAEAVNTACYVQNRVLVTKPHNKTPYELLHGRLPSIGFMRPFACYVTILNTLDPLGKFQGKVDEGFLVGYSVCSSGPAWLFDIDSLTLTMNYHPVLVDNQSNTHTGFQDTKKAREEGTQTYMLFPVLSDGSINPKNNNKDSLINGKQHDDDIQKSMSPDIHSSSCGDQTRKQGDKTENKDKVSAAGLNFTNSTNDFSAAGVIIGSKGCVGVGRGHTRGIRVVAFANKPHNFFVSVIVLKVWSLENLLDDVNDSFILKSKAVRAVHDKDTNVVAIAPIDLLSTGSQVN
nr:hypothetical protein [Tanacetum cinerariifolium]